MTFVADERGRVPFALIAGLLLVSTLGYSSGLVHEAPSDPVTPRTVEAATESARLRLATAARAAGRDAARAPVLTAADSSTGRLLAADPFERALALRIAVAVRESLPVRRTVDDTTVTVRLTSIADLATTRRALQDVHLDRLGDDRVRVSVEDAHVVVRRDGLVVENWRTTLTTTVSLPVFALHERTREFDERLDASAIEPGLARSLTPRLYAVAWVRGYAQYGGAPIGNVLANRHVGVLANDALLAQQAAVFGRADPAGHRAVARAMGQVAVADGVAGLQSAATTRLAAGRGGNRSAAPVDAMQLPSVMDEPQRVGVDRSADRAFVEFTVDRRLGGLERALTAAYRARIRPRASTHLVDSDVDRDGDRPANGSLGFTTHDTDYDVDGGGVEPGHGETVVTYDRTVTVSETDRSYWFANGTYAGATSVTRERTYGVTVAVDCRYEPPASVPDRPVRGECPFGADARGSLVERTQRAVDRRYGGPDELAEGAVRGRHRFDTTSVQVSPPASARRRAYRAAAALRDEVRAIHVETPRLSMASTANPASELAATIRARRRSLVDVPTAYGSAAAVAAVGARAGYLDELRSALQGRSSAVSRMQGALGDLLAQHAVPERPPTGRSPSLSRIATDVDADPVYLSLAARRGGSPPLAARNLNLFTVPYGDAGDVVAGAVDGDGDTVSLSTATETLVASEVAPTDDPALDARQARLRRAVERSLDRIRAEQRDVVRRGPAVSNREARAAVRAGYDGYDSTAARARAVLDGDIAHRIAAHLPRSLAPTERDRVATQLRVATVDARRDASVRLSESTVAGVPNRLRPMVRTGLDQATRVATQRAASMAKRRAFRSAAATMPAGLPILPMPGQWYATVNVWVVSVRGGYDRFAVHSPRASPVSNGSITYVRESAPVTLDVDGDGTAERLGRNRRIDLSAHTGVVVVVPPGPRGVGDTGGNADERSPGW